MSNPIPTGCGYLTCYSGILNIIEEVLNISIVISVLVSGLTTEGHILNFVALLAFVMTTILIILHAKGIIRRSKLPWHWIECVMVLITAIVVAIFSTFALSVYTKGYIITAVIGYLVSAIYFVDCFDKYQIATMPVPRYAWTTPNMPDLN